MNYNIIQQNDKIIINIKDFEPKHIFECGQCFRWYTEDKSYITIHNGKILNVKKEGDNIIFNNTNIEDFKNIWYDYFDLDKDYGEIKKELSKDPILEEAIKFGEGIRILKQDPFETIISFIISANNQIPRIKKSIELICKNYGKNIGTYNGNEYFSFPSAKVLSNVDEKELEEKCKVGYRAKYIINTSKMINEINIDNLFHLSRQDAKEILMKLPGVGPKVSDCVLLFAFNKYDAFPVDVWVKRVMEYFYLKEDTKQKDIAIYADKKFGYLAGFAQQYLFYYARELGIGKKKK